MTTYRKLSLTLCLYGAVSLVVTITPLMLRGMVGPLWQTVTLSGLPFLMLCGAWLFVGVTDRRHSLDEQTESERKQATGAIYSAGLVLLVAQVLAVLKIYGQLDGEASDQLFGFAVGAFVVILGNATPKVVFSSKTLELRKLTAPAAQSIGRFSGLSLMLAGVGMMLVWVLLPHEMASVVAPALVITALIASFTHFLFARKA